MTQNEETNGQVRTGPATYLVEAVVAFIVLVIGAVVVYGSRELGSGWTSDGPGAGYFPFYIGSILCLSGGGILYQALLGKNKNTKPFIDAGQFKRVMSVLVPIGLYILAVQFLGLYIASALYIALFMIILGKFLWGKSIITALIVTILFFMMFEVWFKIPLFKGKFDLLSFLGY